jgi:hypothetical protein
MLVDFLFHLRRAKLPVSLHEHLRLLEALKAGVVGPSVDQFYWLARMTLVKDERLFDRFDRAFAVYFKGVSSLADALSELQTQLPDDWLKRILQREFSAAEKAAIDAAFKEGGGLDALLERLKNLLDEQHKRHEGGSKWIGTNGSSQFGNGGYHPEGIRIGGPSAGNRTAIKVWEQRAYRDYDDTVELGTRNIKIALRRLRRFARQGAPDELDLDGTIGATARNAGWLDLRMRPERHNNVKVLLLMDVGGSMDDHVRRTEELFSAARSEFRNLEFFYFHNCVYDHLWKNNRRRGAERTDTWDLIRRFNPDWRLVLVGDATMSPYEILQPGGSVEYHNEESGAQWLRRLLDRFPRSAWLNPEPEGIWNYRQSIGILRQIMGERMYPVSLSGLDRAMRSLMR